MLAFFGPPELSIFFLGGVGIEVTSLKSITSLDNGPTSLDNGPIMVLFVRI